MKKKYLHNLLQFILPKRLLTTFAGTVADLKITWLKNFLIKRFIKIYQVNMNEARESHPECYATFNEFFIRKLHSDARPFSPQALVCPVDGILSETGSIQNGQLLQAKGRTYTLGALIDEPPETCLPFLNGYFSTFYLAPKDYHRIHMPIDGKVKKMIYLPGKLFSVQPATVNMIPALFAKNERVVIYFDTPRGEMVMVLVGATIVGKMATSWHGEFRRTLSRQVYNYGEEGTTLKQGEELGYFKLGSTVILLMEASAVPLEAPLLKGNTPVKLFQQLI